MFSIILRLIIAEVDIVTSQIPPHLDLQEAYLASVNFIYTIVEHLLRCTIQVVPRMRTDTFRE